MSYTQKLTGGLSFVLFILIAMTQAAGQANKLTISKNKTADKSQKPPKNFVAMEVLGVIDDRGGQAVILKEDVEGYRLPIYIGPTEAFAIQLRLDRRRFQRPLTHDLLDTILQKLGGQLIKIHVDDLRDNTFMGTIFIKHQERIFSIDARPSDSIALALSNKAPIFVSKKVLKRAGFRKDPTLPDTQPNLKDPDGLLKDILTPKKQEQTL